MIPAARDICHLRQHIGLRSAVVDGRRWHERDRQRSRIHLQRYGGCNRVIVDSIRWREHGLQAARTRRQDGSSRRRVREAAGDACGGIKLRGRKGSAVADGCRRGPGDCWSCLLNRESFGRTSRKIGTC